MKNKQKQLKNKEKTSKVWTQKLTIKYVIPENTLSEEAKNKLVERDNLYYKIIKYTYNFQNFWTTSTFGRDIYNGTITIREADNDQSGLIVTILSFRKQVKPKHPEKKQQKEDVLKNLYNLFEGRERILNSFDRKIFLIKFDSTGFSDNVPDHSNLKLLTPKQIL